MWRQLNRAAPLDDATVFADFGNGSDQGAAVQHTSSFTPSGSATNNAK